MREQQAISFSFLQKSDFPLLHKWLNIDFVKQWYGKEDDITREFIVEHYSPYVEGRKPTQGYIIQCGNTPVGYIQTYLIKDYPDYSKYVQVESGAAGLDLFIGDEEYIHKGLGKGIIQLFLGNVVFANPGVTSCVLGPEPNNSAAIKTYEKVGFKYVKTIHMPDEMEPECIMALRKEDFFS